MTDSFLTARILQALPALLADDPPLLAKLESQFQLRFAEFDFRTLMAVETVEQILLTIARAGRLTIPYELATRIDIGTFGSLDYYLHSCDTVGEALTELQKYHELLLQDLSAVQIQIEGNELVLQANLAAADVAPPGKRLRHAMMVSMIVRYIQLLNADDTLMPLRCESSLMPFLSLAQHQSVLGPNITWGSARNALYYPAAMFTTRLRNANPRIRQLLLEEVKTEHERRQKDQSLSQQVMAAIDAIGFEKVSQAAVADRLNVSESTLKRRLAEHELSFTGLLNRLRQDEAVRLLAETSDKIDVVANQLGFSERATFERAFKQWLQISPAQFRQEARISLFSAAPIDATQLRELPMLTNVAHQILTVSQDDGAGARQIAALVEKDPVISARLLALANSPLYAAGRARSVEDAVIRYLGVNVVRRLVLSLIAVDTLAVSDCPGFKARRLWQTALATSWMAACAARHQMLPQPVDVQKVTMLGLIHNLGQLVMAKLRPHDMNRLLPLLDECEQFDDVLALERKVLGITRYMAGYHLLLHWKIPTDVAAQVRALDPTAGTGKDTDPAILLVRQCAAFISDLLGGRGAVDFLPRWRDQTATLLNCNPSEVQQLAILSVAQFDRLHTEALALISD